MKTTKKKVIRKKKKTLDKLRTKNIVLENETLEHIKGYLEVWGTNLEHMKLQRYNRGKNKNKYYGLACIRSKTIT